MEENEPWCHHCGYAPAKYWMPEQKRRICGVCWHRSRVLEDMFSRIRLWRLKQENERLEQETAA